ncbi:MAG: hypothetical protein WCV84_03230 [Patescibacteria group bacterium]
MPRTVRRTSPKRRASSQEEQELSFDREGTANLDSTQKHAVVRDMILRHSLVRANQPQPSKWAFPIGVLASCLVIVSGWWMTLDTNIRFRQPAMEHGLVQTFTESVERTKAAYGTPPSTEDIGRVLSDKKFLEVKDQMLRNLEEAQAEQTSSTAPLKPAQNKR